MPSFIAQNHRIFYREQGSGPLLILLHGNTASSVYHQGELEHFAARGCHAVAFDFWGCGQSDRLAGWTTDWWAQGGRDALALAAHLGGERPILIGTSGGGVAALLAALEAPEAVRAVIADSSTDAQRPEDLRAEVASRRRCLPGQVDFWSRAHGPDWKDVVEEDNRLLLRLADEGGRFFRQDLGGIRCPVLFTASLTDDLIPDAGGAALRMARQIPGSHVFLANGGSHPLMWTRPVEFRAAADIFLARVL
ncbi:predicted hydrolase [Longilinea arvoryzae]|uniref:Predicted hydrolase n=1 Tax=Longilinea arvoryzae TaxID=360412 RepID=A0A0K8MXH9_9CHLR|nr:alpha/beta hydrolase [Longilinea arvoryzae]GAP15954.1 predicted hydrolase [Longilinea arvoryzae]